VVTAHVSVGLEAWCRLCLADLPDVEDLRIGARADGEDPDAHGVLLYFVKPGACALCGSGRFAVWCTFDIEDDEAVRRRSRLPSSS
jgi:hypothetical protein